MAARFSGPTEERYLSTADITVIYKELFEARAKWRRLGIELGLSPGTLDAIQQRHPEPEERLERVLLEWIHGGSAAWRRLVEALCSCLVGETQLAQKLRQQHCLSELANGGSKEMPNHNNDDIEQLHSDIKSMEKRFARFLTVTRNSIKERKVPPECLVALLSAYRMFPAVRKREDKLLADRQEDLESASSIDKIFTIVAPFLSFLDFEILEDIINNNDLGTESDRQNLTEYSRSLKEFLNSWKVEPCQICRDERELIESRVKLYLKLDTDSLSMYRNVKVAIARILEVQVYTLQLCSVQNGCIELLFLFPKTARSIVLPLLSLRHKLSELEPQVLKISLEVENTTESLVLKDTPLQELNRPFTLKCRRGKHTPIKIRSTVLSVVINDCVYIGGSFTGNKLDNCTVLKFDSQRCEWSKLPPYRASFFAMTSLANQLVLVGGQDIVTRKLTNRIVLFASESRKWTRMPPMNVARSWSTAVHFNNYIIVAGGLGHRGRTSSVEVFDAASRKWHFAKSLPKPCALMKSTLIGNTLFLMGGYDHNNPTKVVHTVNLNELIAKAIFGQAAQSLWLDIKDTPLEFSAPLNIGGSLVAVGGRDDKLSPSSSIHLYQPDTRRWVKVGNLPTARYNCTCSILPSGEVIVAGDEIGSVSTVGSLFITAT